MQKFTFWLGVAILSLTTTICFAQETIKDTSTGQTFPGEVSVSFNGQNFQLDATGVATRKKFFVKVYSIAHYMQDPDKGAGIQQVMEPGKAKQLTMIWVRNVGQDKIVDGFRETFGKNLTRTEMNQIQNDINTFLNFYTTGANKGDEHVLRWFPNGTVELWIKGQLTGTIQSDAFGKGLWSLWFGPKAAVNRNDLISALK